MGSNEDYFLHNDGMSSVHTSDHTLSRLAVPRLSSEVLRSVVSQSTLDHVEERAALLQEHCLMFDKWMTLLQLVLTKGSLTNAPSLILLA